LPYGSVDQGENGNENKNWIEIMIITSDQNRKRNSVCAYCVNKRSTRIFQVLDSNIRESALKYTVPRKNTQPCNKMPKNGDPNSPGWSFQEQGIPQGEVIGDSRRDQAGTPMGIVRMVCEQVKLLQQGIHNTFDAFTVSISS
jgi:hypothetical protein